MYLLDKDGKWSRKFSEKTRVDRRKVKLIRTTTIEPYLKDYSFFALSPLYFYAGVGYSMPDQFEIEAGPQDRIVVDYQRTVIGGVKRWGPFVEGIATAVWEDFCHYMSTVMFVSFAKGIVWQVRTHDISVEGTSSNLIVDPDNLPVQLRIFLPDGNMGRMFAKGGCPAKLWWDDPHPVMVEAARKILSHKGRIEDAS